MENKKRRVWLRVILIVLGVIVLGAAALAVWQKENLQAFVVSRQYSTEQLENMLSDNEVKTEDILKRMPGISVRPLTKDEQKKLRGGELTENEVVEMILQPIDLPLGAAPPIDPSSGDSAAAVSPKETTELEERERQIAELVARIYVLREVMTGRLDEILRSAKSDYASIPQERRTVAVKQDIAKRSMDKAFALERECDGQINAILGELETLLRETGGDTAIIAEIKQAYNDEKSLKKSYYLNLYS